MSSKQCNRATYFETLIIDDVGAGGVCIGVGTSALKLNRLVGSDEQSVGLHSSGALITKSGKFHHGFARPFGTGDRVGCVVRVMHKGVWDVAFTVNGVCVGRLGETVVRWNQLNTEEDTQLFGAVSVYKKDTKVVFLCCPQDWCMASLAQLTEQLSCPVEPLCTIS